jgi:hypothetical protein
MRRALTGGAGDDGMVQRFSLFVWPDQSPQWEDADRYPASEPRANAWGAFNRLDEMTPAPSLKSARAWLRTACRNPISMLGRGCNAKSHTRLPMRDGVRRSGPFLDQWGKLADSFGWTPGDLFDVPCDGAMGLAWWLKGRAVTALGPEHACVGQPAYDRVTRREWVNPYSRPVRPVSLSPILEHQQKIMQRVLGRLPPLS